jgi:hypothetical protein
MTQAEVLAISRLIDCKITESTLNRVLPGHDDVLAACRQSVLEAADLLLAMARQSTEEEIYRVGKE